MYIHLVSLTKGAMRMVMVSQLDPTGHMRGLITTLNKQRASFVPVSTPIVYVKRDEFADVALGELAAGHPSYRELQAATGRNPRAGLCAPARRLAKKLNAPIARIQALAR